MTIDLSIVTYHSSAHIEACLQAIIAQTLPLDQIHLTIFDNASSDDTVARAHAVLNEHHSAFASVRIVEQDANLGFGKAHNAALREGVSEYVFILNPDTELTPTCLATLYETAQRDEPDVAVWEPRQVPYDHPKWYDACTLETHWCSGAALLMRRRAFEAVNGFEPLLFLYCEDVDLSWRLRARGYRLRYIPSATLYHYSYDDPTIVKHHQWLGELRGNLLLRLRFGTWCDVLHGMALQWDTFKRTGGYGKKLMLRWWVKMLMHTPKIRREQFHGDAGMQFAKWDYGSRYSAKNYTFHHNQIGIELPYHPRVSVVIRTMGARIPLLRDAIRSVLNQTYPHDAIEIIVVQDGEATLGDVLSDHDYGAITMRYEPLGSKQGRSAAGNHGVRVATGEYCVFLDDDDLLLADHLEQLVATAQTTHASVAYGYGWEVPSEYASDGQTIAAEHAGLVRYDEEEFSFPRLLSYNYLPINAVLFAREAFFEAGEFDTSLDFLEDWDLWVRLAYLYRPFALIRKVVCVYRVPHTKKVRHDRDQTFAQTRLRVRIKHNQMPVQMKHSDIATWWESKQEG
ncbi:MAG: glycosyltransferase [Alphaproteobacteria bacterium]|nr:MAG: glycosyltransferase [Alphaproteobacteria bacterium]